MENLRCRSTILCMVGYGSTRTMSLCAGQLHRGSEMWTVAGYTRRTNFWHRLRSAMFIGAIIVVVAIVVSVFTIVAGAQGLDLVHMDGMACVSAVEVELSWMI